MTHVEDPKYEYHYRLLISFGRVRVIIIYIANLESLYTCLLPLQLKEHTEPLAECGQLLPRIRTYVGVQRNLSIKDTLNGGHLTNEDTVCCPNHTELCISMHL